MRPRWLNVQQSLFFSCVKRIPEDTNKRSGEAFGNQVYSNTDLINAYLHIHASLGSVLNNM